MHDAVKEISMFWIIPFVGILLSIAIIPLVNGDWWHHNFPKVSLFWGLPMVVAMYFLFPERLFHTGIEFCSFIALIGSLYVISSGIFIHGSFKPSPLTNCAFFALGAVLANMIGTAGASMVLVRPMLRINSTRKSKVHIFVFFIFIVSNIGGSLTPLGDPPLFLGFLQGVPFHWTLTHMFPGWLFAVGSLLVIFFIIDTIILKRDGGDDIVALDGVFRLEGRINFLFLLGVLITVIMYGNVLPKSWGFGREFVQIVLMCTFAALSYRFTPNNVHIENEFSWFPVKEVAIVFAAIFVCMIPALDILEYKGSTGALAVSKPWQFFWMAGSLSSFLDNAPTYLVFLSLGKTLGVVSGGVCSGISVIGGCVPVNILKAISMGAVFMGANTYIGNAPNFMVKSICKENKVELPSFFGYMAWSMLILIPLFIVITLIFFRA